MPKEISVKVPFEELKAWKALFNDKENWGIKAQFERETGKRTNTLNWTLARGSAFPSTVSIIRRFVKKHKHQLQNA